jgi:hypothetical protein
LSIKTRLDKVFQKMVDFSDYPHQSTFSRHLPFIVPTAKKIGGVNVSLLMRARNERKLRTFLVPNNEYQCLTSISWCGLCKRYVGHYEAFE